MSYRLVDVVVPMRADTEPLDYLPAPLLAVWTRRLRHDYAGGCFRTRGGSVAEEALFLEQPLSVGDLDLGFLARYGEGAGRVDAVRDQSGAGRDLTRGTTPGPTAAAEGAPESESGRPVWGFAAADSAVLGRSDALGLGADPALTIAWRSRGGLDADDGRALLALGTAAAPELAVVLVNGGGVVEDRLWFAGPAPDFDLGGEWILPTGTLQGWHSYVLTKPESTGYDATDWRLLVDGADQGAPIVEAGSLALGAELTALGACPGLDPLDARVEGLLVWDRVLDSEPDLGLLLRYLQADSRAGLRLSRLEALGLDGAFWVLDGVYLSAT